jgi:poly(3-hydroxybutyrate) depolymerase
MLAYRFACERGGLVRGVVGLAGVLVTPSCSGAAGVRVLHVHGQKDTLVPVEGGGAGEQLSGARFRSVEETVGALRAGGASVELLLVAGGEHGVPSLDAAARVERGAPLAALLGRFVRGEKVTDRP